MNVKSLLAGLAAVVFSMGFFACGDDDPVASSQESGTSSQEDANVYYTLSSSYSGNNPSFKRDSVFCVYINQKLTSVGASISYKASSTYRLLTLKKSKQAQVDSLLLDLQKNDATTLDGLLSDNGNTLKISYKLSYGGVVKYQYSYTKATDSSAE